MLYLLRHPLEVLQLSLQHLQLVGTALTLAIVFSTLLTLLIWNFPYLKAFILAILGIFYTIPSLALMILLIPLLGLSPWTVIWTMVIYSQLILVRNLVVGLEEIPAPILETAQAIGMKNWQQWSWVKIPLILPAFVAGVRLTATIDLALATIGAKFNAGGLGQLLFEGIQTNRYDKILAGSISVSFLALSFNFGLSKLEKHLTKNRIIT